MNTITKPQSRLQEEFLEQHARLVSEGLVSVHYAVGDVSKATVDDFIRESNAIDAAIKNKRYVPFPESF